MWLLKLEKIFHYLCQKKLPFKINGAYFTISVIFQVIF